MSTLQDFKSMLAEKNLSTDKVKDLLSSAESTLSPEDFACFQEDANKKMNNKDIRYDETQKGEEKKKSPRKMSEEALARIPARKEAAKLKYETLKELQHPDYQSLPLPTDPIESPRPDPQKVEEFRELETPFFVSKNNFSKDRN